MKRASGARYITHVDDADVPPLQALQMHGLYEVGSERTTGKTYVVDLLQGTCTCPSFAWRGVKCKHMRAAESQQSRDHALETLEGPDISPRGRIVVVQEGPRFIDLVDRW